MRQHASMSHSWKENSKRQEGQLSNLPRSHLVDKVRFHLFESGKMANNSTSVVESVSPGNNTLDDAAAIIWQHVAISAMLRYLFLIIFIIGWINNCLSILVLQTKAYRGTSTGFLMTVLACADIGLVCTSAAQFWVFGLANVDVRLYSPMGCAWHSHDSSGLCWYWTCVHLSCSVLGLRPG